MRRTRTCTSKVSRAWDGCCYRIFLLRSYCHRYVFYMTAFCRRFSFQLHSNGFTLFHFIQHEYCYFSFMLLVVLFRVLSFIRYHLSVFLSLCVSCFPFWTNFTFSFVILYSFASFDPLTLFPSIFAILFLVSFYWTFLSHTHTHIPIRLVHAFAFPCPYIILPSKFKHTAHHKYFPFWKLVEVSQVTGLLAGLCIRLFSKWLNDTDGVRKENIVIQNTTWLKRNGCCVAKWKCLKRAIAGERRNGQIYKTIFSSHFSHFISSQSEMCAKRKGSQWTHCVVNALSRKHAYKFYFMHFTNHLSIYIRWNTLHPIQSPPSSSH